jgi:N-acetylmuramoyl-L-alanine amidase
VIISVHANAAEDSRAKGVELFVQNPLDTEEESMYLAHQESQILQEKDKEAPESLSKSRDVAAIISDLHRQNKFLKSLELSEVMRQMWLEQRPKASVQIKQAPFYVISHSQIPAILVEIGFLSHPQESKLLKDQNYQQQIAEIIYQSVIKYLNPKNSDKLMAVY